MCLNVNYHHTPVSSGDPSSSESHNRPSTTTTTFTSTPAATNLTTLTTTATIATTITTATTAAAMTVGLPASHPIMTTTSNVLAANAAAQDQSLLSSAAYDSNGSMHDCTTLAPITAAAAPPSSSGVSMTTGSEQPLSWAWISPRSSRDSLPKDTNLGFVFQKPSSENVQRPRKASPKRRRSSSSRRTQQLRPISPDYRSMASSSTPVFSPPTPDEGAAMLADAAMSLDIDAVLAQMTQVPAMIPPASQEPPASSSSTSSLSPLSVGTPSSDSIMHELGMSNPNDLSALLGNLLSNNTCSSPVSKLSSSSFSSMDYHPSPMASNARVLPSASTTNRFRGGCCGSFASAPTCQPSGANQGESVVITITPLPKPDQAASSEMASTTTTTRIVTCYCGPSCNCPGCLVHPGNSFLGNPALDPYAGLVPSNQTTSCSSASSSCGSDDEEGLGM